MTSALLFKAARCMIVLSFLRGFHGDTRTRGYTECLSCQHVWDLLRADGGTGQRQCDPHLGWVWLQIEQGCGYWVLGMLRYMIIVALVSLLHSFHPYFWSGSKLDLNVGAHRQLSLLQCGHDGQSAPGWRACKNYYNNYGQTWVLDGMLTEITVDIGRIWSNSSLSIVSVHCWKEGWLGLYIPDDQEISWGPIDVLRGCTTQCILTRGSEWPFSHHLSIPGVVSGNTSLYIYVIFVPSITSSASVKLFSLR